jgi:hypothetical protein
VPQADLGTFAVAGNQPKFPLSERPLVDGGGTVAAVIWSHGWPSRLFRSYQVRESFLRHQELTRSFFGSWLVQRLRWLAHQWFGWLVRLTKPWLGDGF